MLEYLLIFIFALIGTGVSVFFIRSAAFRYGVLDIPKNDGKKIHTQATPLWGGAAVFFGILLSLLIAVFLFGVSDELSAKNFFGIFLAASVLLVGGMLDDKYNYSPRIQFLFQIIAGAIVLVSGIGLDAVTNPFGGLFSLQDYNILIFTWNGVPYFFNYIADTVVFAWLMVLMNTTKLLDGMDGLVSGVSVIAACIIFLISLDWDIAQSFTSYLALAMAGAFSGFLIWNWHPAKMFLGESGALLSGFFLGVLSILTGSKIATTALIMALPIIDVLWIMFRRTILEKRSAFQGGDNLHLHHILLRSGIGYKNTVFLLYAFTLLFGICALYLGTSSKIYIFILLFCVMLTISFYIRRWILRSLEKRSSRES